jgi:hypothetical protein
MRQASKRIPESAEKTVRDIRRATRRHHSAEEKIRIVLEGPLQLQESPKKSAPAERRDVPQAAIRVRAPGYPI